MNYFKFAVGATDTHVVPASNIRALVITDANTLVAHCTGNTYAANEDQFTITATAKAKAVQVAIISAANQPVNTSGAFIDVAAIDGVSAITKSLAA